MASVDVVLVPVVATAHIFAPGDRVLICVRDNVSPEQIDQVKAALGDEFPGVHFVVTVGLVVGGVQSA